jgi:hypothetical protein
LVEADRLDAAYPPERLDRLASNGGLEPAPDR